MGKRIVAIMLVVCLLNGCGKSADSNESSVAQIDSSGEVGNTVAYILKPIDDTPKLEEQPVTEVSDIELQEQEAQIESNLTIDSINEDINFMDIVDKIHLPDNYVVTMDIGNFGLKILMGEAGGYKLSGTASYLMWESENGTFYRDSSGVKSVKVSGRSSLFTEKDDEDGTSVSAGLNIDDAIDVDYIKEQIDDTIDIKCKGIQKFNGKNCYVFGYSTMYEDGTEEELCMYINIADYSICGMDGLQDGINVSMIVSDYYDITSELESIVSGTIEDETASSAVEESMMSVVLGMLFGAMAQGDMGFTMQSDLDIEMQAEEDEKEDPDKLAREQELLWYDNKEVDGSTVISSAKLFQGRDIAIVIHTTAMKQQGMSLAANYGALLTGDGKASNGASNLPYMYNDLFYNCTFHDGKRDDNYTINRDTSDKYYIGYLHNTNGLIDHYYNLNLLTEVGNISYVDSSANFNASLIVDKDDNIIGIFFKQI